LGIFLFAVCLDFGSALARRKTNPGMSRVEIANSPLATTLISSRVFDDHNENKNASYMAQPFMLTQLGVGRSHLLGTASTYLDGTPTQGTTLGIGMVNSAAPSRYANGYVRTDGYYYEGRATVTLSLSGQPLQSVVAEPGGYFEFHAAPIGGVLTAIVNGYSFGSLTVDDASPYFIIDGVSVTTPTPTPSPSPSPTPGQYFLSGSTFFNVGGMFNYTYIQLLSSQRVEISRLQEQDSTYEFSVPDGTYIVRPMVEVWEMGYRTQPSEYLVTVCGNDVSGLNFTIGADSTGYPMGGSLTVSCNGPIPTSTPKPAATPLTIPPQPSFLDPAGGTWSLAGTTIYRNGVVVGSGNLLILCDGFVYAQSTTSVWYIWNGTTWSQLASNTSCYQPSTSSTPVPTPTPIGLDRDDRRGPWSASLQRGRFARRVYPPSS